MSTEETLQSFRNALAAASTPEALNEVRTAYLGKKSYVKTALKSLGSMSHLLLTTTEGLRCTRYR